MSLLPFLTALLDLTLLSVFPPARYLARLCHQYWTSEEVLPKVTDVPILFLSGLQDELVP